MVKSGDTVITWISQQCGMVSAVVLQIRPREFRDNRRIALLLLNDGSLHTQFIDMLYSTSGLTL